MTAELFISIGVLAVVTAVTCITGAVCQSEADAEYEFATNRLKYAAASTDVYKQPGREVVMSTDI
jgi:hypothetical protein